ncbi:MULTISPECIES: hypothetical protein [unclassified Micromonospora]|uniref:hypothetical protein n=1 Tax=Micromonospora sp. NPDC049903 TaxID=3364276 RepID=UPI0037A3FB70
MANITVDFERVKTVNDQLNLAVTQTVPRLEDLRNAVSQLLTSDGGLWLQRSSPTLSGQYQTFNTELTSAIENIRSFAQQFHNITVQLRTMDDQISTSSSGG